MHVRIYIFILWILSNVCYSQTFDYSYTDPCTGNKKTIQVPSNGITVTYYGQIHSFQPADFNNGVFDSWASTIYNQFGNNNPCSSLVGLPTAVSIAQDSAITLISVINSLSAISDITSSIAEKAASETSGSTNMLSSIGSLQSSTTTENKKENKQNSRGSSNSSNPGNPNSTVSTNNSNTSNGSGSANSENSNSLILPNNSNTSNGSGSSNLSNITGGSNISSGSTSNNSPNESTSSNTSNSTGVSNISSGSVSPNSTNVPSSVNTSGNSTSSNTSNGQISVNISNNPTSTNIPNGSISTGSSNNNNTSGSATSGNPNGSNVTESSTSTSSSGSNGNVNYNGQSTSNVGGSNNMLSSNVSNGSASSNTSISSNANVNYNGQTSPNGTSGNNQLNSNTNTQNNGTSTTSEDKPATNLVGSSINSIGNSTTSKASAASKNGNRPTILASSDFVGFNFKKSETSYGGKFTGGFTSTRWDGLRSSGIMADYTTAIKGPNLTGFYAFIGDKKIDLISTTLTFGFDTKTSYYATVALGEMRSFKKIKNLKVVYMISGSFGKVYGEPFIGTAAIAGGMYDMKVSKRYQMKMLLLYVYCPYVSYYNDILLKSPQVVLPIVGTNVGLTKRFKININIGGAFDLKNSAMNYTIMMGTRLLL